MGHTTDLRPPGAAGPILKVSPGNRLSYVGGMDDPGGMGPYATSFRTFDGENVVLQVMADLPSPKTTDDWAKEPYSGLQEKIDAYRATHPGIKIRVVFKQNL